MASNVHWQKLCEEFRMLSKVRKAGFLARLTWALTIAGRATGEAGTDNVLYPQVLRRINELVHRTSSFQFDVIYDKERQSDEDFFDYIATELSKIGCSEQVFKDAEKKFW